MLINNTNVRWRHTSSISSIHTCRFWARFLFRTGREASFFSCTLHEWVVYSQHAWVALCLLCVKSTMHKNQCACVCSYCQSVYLVVLSVTQRRLTKKGSGQGVGEGRARQEAVPAPCSLSPCAESLGEFSGILWSLKHGGKTATQTADALAGHQQSFGWRLECLRATTAGQSIVFTTLVSQTRQFKTHSWWCVRLWQPHDLIYFISIVSVSLPKAACCPKNRYSLGIVAW